MNQSRRSFFRTAGAVSLGFAGLHRFETFIGSGLVHADGHEAGYGGLVRDPDRILDLPEGFTYRAFSRTGEVMDDGLYVPGAHDGMAAFAGPEGKTILVRNHELSPAKPGKEATAFGKDAELIGRVAEDRFYDAGEGKAFCPGGTTTLIYDTQTQQLEQHWLSLVGTVRNCAGGPTPWGSWITCEESTLRKGEDGTLVDHGYNFEVPALTEVGLVDPIPLIAMGRFNHEAVAVDPESGIVYQTEDTSDGLIYRYIPNEPGKLHKGGRLQCLASADVRRLDTRNWENIEVPTGRRMRVRWIDLDDVTSPDDDLRYRGYGKGAALFARGEGMWYGNNAIYFACTNGGKGKFGQIWQYTPSLDEGTADEEKNPGELVLYAEATSKDMLERADNLTVAPWGDVIATEDGPEVDHLVGITPKGEYYKLARNMLNTSELAGAVFSPDGSTLFVNIQSPGITFAITGPWKS